MMEAVFGLAGVLIGSGISWFQTYWVSKKETEKNARYLAIRVVVVLDKYLEKCAEVVNDDGLNCGQRDAEGCLVAQVKSPGGPIYPEDVDWKSIDHELMYKILSLPAEVEDAQGLIDFTTEIATPPDYDEWFDERAYWYAQFGLAAYILAGELGEKFGVKRKTYNSWDPVTYLSDKLQVLKINRDKRISNWEDIVQKVFESRP